MWNFTKESSMKAELVGLKDLIEQDPDNPVAAPQLEARIKDLEKEIEDLRGQG